MELDRGDTRERHGVIVLQGCDKVMHWTVSPLTSTWPHLYSDVGLEEGEY